MKGLPKQLIYSIANRLVLNFAAMVFLGVTFFLTWQVDAWQSLFGLRGFTFLLCGLIVSGGFIGAVSARSHQQFAKIIVSRSADEPNARAAGAIRWAGTIVLLVQILLVYYLAAWAFELWVLNPRS